VGFIKGMKYRNEFNNFKSGPKSGGYENRHYLTNKMGTKSTKHIRNSILPSVK